MRQKEYEVVLGNPNTQPYGHRQVKKRHGTDYKCTCGANWCTQHNDCVWECWDINEDRHMTDEEYKCQRQTLRQS